MFSVTLSLNHSPSLSIPRLHILPPTLNSHQSYIQRNFVHLTYVRFPLSFSSVRLSNLVLVCGLKFPEFLLKQVLLRFYYFSWFPSFLKNFVPSFVGCTGSRPLTYVCYTIQTFCYDKSLLSLISWLRMYNVVSTWNFCMIHFLRTGFSGV